MFSPFGWLSYVEAMPAPQTFASLKLGPFGRRRLRLRQLPRRLAPQKGYVSLASCLGRLINSENDAGALVFRCAQVGSAPSTSPAAVSTIEAFARLRSSTAMSATSRRPRVSAAA